MKKLNALAIASAALLVAGSANATTTLVAGWDFSSVPSGLISSNTQTAAALNQIDSSYCDFQYDANAVGVDCAPLGTAFFDGTNGSSTQSGVGSPFVVITPLESGLNGAMGAGATVIGSGASRNILIAETAQTSSNGAGLGANSNTAQVVFGFDLSSVGQTASNIQLSFAGGDPFGAGQGVLIEFSTDGIAYTPVVGTGAATDTDAGGIATLNTTFGQFILSSVAGGSSTGFFRASFLNNTGNPAGFDNVAIKADVAVPEPGTIVLGLAALAGLARFGRRRA